MSNQKLILLIFLSSVFIYSINLWFSISGFYFVILTLLLGFCIIYFNNQFSKTVENNISELLVFGLFVFIGISFTSNIIDINGELSLAMWLNRFFIFLSLLATISLFLKKMPNKILNFLITKSFFILLSLSLLIQVTDIRIVRKPDIDVFDVLRWGPVEMISGHNPYETSASVENFKGNPTKYHHYAYGPTTLYLFLPFDLIFRDPRYLLVISNIIVAISLYLITKKSWKDQKIAELTALLYLFNPKLSYFLTYSWTDGLIVALIALAVLTATYKINLVGIFLSLAVGIKIFYLLPLLFLFKNQSFRKLKIFVFGLSTLMLIHLPFLILNWKAMYTSMVTINTGGQTFAQLQRFTLTLATFLDRQFHYYPPQFIFPIMALLMSSFFWITVPKAINASITNAIIGVVFIAFLFGSPIANASYYFTGSQILLLSFCLAGKNFNYNFEKTKA